MNPQLKPIFPYIPEHLENKIFIKSTGFGDMGKSVLKFSYFTSGMNWDVEYHLVIKDEDKATFSGNVVFSISIIIIRASGCKPEGRRFRGYFFFSNERFDLF